MTHEPPEDEALDEELTDSELDGLSCAVAEACTLWLQTRYVEPSPLVIRQVGATLIGLGARTVEETQTDATVVLSIAAENVRYGRS